jgi:hypothetical protein
MPASSGLSTLHQKLNTHFEGRHMGVLRQEVFLICETIFINVQIYENLHYVELVSRKVPKFLRSKI